MTADPFDDETLRRFTEAYDVVPLDLPTELGETPLRIEVDDLHRFDPDLAVAALEEPEQFAESITEFLHQSPGNAGIDLRSIDVELGNVPASEFDESA